jgi:hypothetical protein
MTNAINPRSPDFNSYESYVAWRAEWRSHYKTASQMIRDTRTEIRQAYRDGDQDQASRLQSLLHYQRRRANELMQARTAATELMREQRSLALAQAA